MPLSPHIYTVGRRQAVNVHVAFQQYINYLHGFLFTVVKGKGKGLAKDVQKGPEVCNDPLILTTHAMGLNIYKNGSDVQLKDDSQYPEW